MPIEILMPALSPTMEEGNLTKWLVAEGDEVRSGDLLAEIETDKATMEIEAVEEGVLVKILIPEGSQAVKVNTPMAILLEEDEDASVLDNYQPGQLQISPVPTQSEPTPSAPSTANETSQTAQAPISNPSTSDVKRVKASPLAKRLAKEFALDIALISGTGPNGRIIKNDVLAAQQSGSAKPQPVAAPTRNEAANTTQSSQPSTSQEVGMLRGGGAQTLEKMGIAPGTYDLEPLDGMRRIIAKRLSESSQTVPHFPLNIDCQIDALLALRKQLNEQAPEGVKISVNDMLIRASAIALKQVPEANASFTDEGIAYHHHADIAVAVAIDGGLITPIITQAENKGLSTVSIEMKDLAARARDRKLKPHEFQGGTFSISNLGMFGIKSFQSIINQPQGMILSVGAGAPTPIVKDGEIAIATVMTVTLACDHRVVDGAIGAKWLQAFKRLIEQPITMML